MSDKQMTSMGARIRSRRKALGLTLEQVADAVGVGYSTVRKWEVGAIANMKRDKIQKLSEILGINPIEFVFGFNEEIKKDPVALAEKHIEILMDEEFVGLFYKYKSLDAKQRKVVINLIDSLSDTND